MYWHRASLYDTKDEFYDPVASSLQGQVFQGGCHQQEVVEGGGGGERGGGGRRLEVIDGRVMSQAPAGLSAISITSGYPLFV